MKRERTEAKACDQEYRCNQKGGSAAAAKVLLAALILCVAFSALLTGCGEEDHGKVTKLEAKWGGFHWAGYKIEDGDRYVFCTATYEDGTTEDVDDWTMKKPVKIPKKKGISFYVYYGGKRAKATVPPKAKENSGSSSESRPLTREQKNAMLAETLKENYPGHEHDYYIDLLMNEGLTVEEAEEALSGSD
ncbi:MAG: hypothetical protein ACOX41_01925 [Anaerovoracaceae bacterium]|jgi:hypothetical protein